MAERAVIEVLVVDDDPKFRAVVVAVLRAAGDMTVVGEAGDGDQAAELALALLPTVVLLDVRMPGTGGIEAARAIKEGVPSAKVIMLTSSDDEDDLYKALRAGASGYVLKDAAIAELAVSVRAVATGQAVLSPSMAAKLVAEFAEDGPGGRAFESPTAELGPHLSDREREVLRLVALGLPNPQIGERLFLSPHTVKRHVANILAKLHQRTRLDAALFAQRRNLLD